MNNYGLVSIITPSFNCATYIAKTIEAIQAQTYTNWELLITDDCSSDNSTEIIKEYALKDKRIKLFCLEKNAGAAKARNNSISQAKGRYVAFCDSDDRWLPEKLEKQLAFMNEKDCALTYTSYYVTDEADSIIGYVKCLQMINYYKIIRDDGIGCLTAIYDSEKVGIFNMPDLKKRQDWGSWIEIIKKTGTAYGLDEPLALYMVRGNSLSSNKVKLLRYNFNVYHKVLKFNKIASCLILGGIFLPYYAYKKLKQKFDFMKLTKTSIPTVESLLKKQVLKP